MATYGSSARDPTSYTGGIEPGFYVHALALAALNRTALARSKK